MNEAAKAARRAYKREWNKRNPDKLRKYQEDYWNRKAKQAAEANAAGDPAEGTEAQQEA